jgi:hypothetical protein
MLLAGKMRIELSAYLSDRYNSCLYMVTIAIWGVLKDLLRSNFSVAGWDWNGFDACVLLRGAALVYVIMRSLRAKY